MGITRRHRTIRIIMAGRHHRRHRRVRPHRRLDGVARINNRPLRRLVGVVARTSNRLLLADPGLRSGDLARASPVNLDRRGNLDSLDSRMRRPSGSRSTLDSSRRNNGRSSPVNSQMRGRSSNSNSLARVRPRRNRDSRPLRPESRRHRPTNNSKRRLLERRAHAPFPHLKRYAPGERIRLSPGAWSCHPVDALSSSATRGCGRGRGVAKEPSPVRRSPEEEA